MENLKLKITGICMLLIFAFGCDEEAPLPQQQDDQLLEQYEITVNSEGGDGYYDARFRVECELLGPTSVNEGSNFTLTMDTNLTSPVITWSYSYPVVLISTSGLSATFNTTDECIGTTRISATVRDGGHSCTDYRDITIKQKCPSTLDIDYLCEDAVIAALAYTKGTSRVDWEYRSGKRGTPVYMATSYNPNCNATMQQPLYFPASWWDGRTLSLTAKITKIDGTTCSQSRAITLNACPF